MSSANIVQEVTFGPFRMSHLREQADDRFRRAFYSYLAQQVMPSLDGQIVRIDGRVFSHYDQPQFAQLPEVRLRYYYETSFSSTAGVEEAWGELDYDPSTASWTPSPVKPPRVRTLTQKHKVRALQESPVYADPSGRVSAVSLQTGRGDPLWRSSSLGGTSSRVGFRADLPWRFVGLG